MFHDKEFRQINRILLLSLREFLMMIFGEILTLWEDMAIKVLSCCENVSIFSQAVFTARLGQIYVKTIWNCNVKLLCGRGVRQTFTNESQNLKQLKNSPFNDASGEKVLNLIIHDRFANKNRQQPLPFLDSIGNWPARISRLAGRAFFH